MTDWKVGDEAVCVDASPCRCGCGTSMLLEVGRPYVVLAVEWDEVELGLALQLNAMVGTEEDHVFPDWAAAERFRKVVKDKPEPADLWNEIVDACTRKTEVSA